MYKFSERQLYDLDTFDVIGFLSMSSCFYTCCCKSLHNGDILLSMTFGWKLVVQDTRPYMFDCFRCILGGRVEI